jgi:hypothetical protein
VKFTTTRYGTNNLNPTYKLANVEVRAPTPEKFQKDPLKHDDIAGTRSRKTYLGGDVPREVNQIDDIGGTRSIWRHKPRARNHSFNQMCYRDVTHPDPKSSRVTNPLDPVYIVPTKEGPAEEIGPVEGSKPALFGNAPSKNYENNKLNTSDIHGG